MSPFLGDASQKSSLQHRNPGHFCVPRYHASRVQTWITVPCVSCAVSSVGTGVTIPSLHSSPAPAHCSAQMDTFIEPIVAASLKNLTTRECCPLGARGQTLCADHVRAGLLSVLNDGGQSPLFKKEAISCWNPLLLVRFYEQINKQRWELTTGSCFCVTGSHWR